MPAPVVDSLPRPGPGAAPRPRAGVVHLGLGAFFRAHGAVYLAETMARDGGDWGIVGVSLRSPDMRDLLAPQGGVYTCVELGPEGTTLRRIDSVLHILVAAEDPRAVLETMADPGIGIVTLTVTEKGYCHLPSTGALDLSHPDVIHDLGHLLPRSAPGYLVRALALRRARGLRPFTVLTCDNLPGNGALVRGVVLDLARAIDPDLALWIADETRFPSTMVDRIVPATSPDDVARLAESTGIDDRAPVMHEPFRQWVVEDDFVDSRRPDLAAVGVQMVADVTPFENMKLRMLNGTHSALAYLGYLAGHETIAETVARPAFAAYAELLWQAEIIPAVAPPPGVDLAAYAAELLQRYRNPAIRHRTWQIAMDGSQKLPQRILHTLAANLAAGRESPGLCLAVAAWMRYVGGVDEQGEAIDVRDPLASRLRAICLAHDTPDARVAALLAVAEVFDPALARGIAPAVTLAHRALHDTGAAACVAALARA